MRRRAVLAAAVPAAVAAARPAAARRSDPATLAAHPLAGAWLAMANPPRPEDPPFAAPSFFRADGTVLLIFPPVQAGPQGLLFQSDLAGTWEADGERTGHFTVVQSLVAADGTNAGSVTIDGHPEVGADGQGFVDADPRSTVTIRDAAGRVVRQMPAVGARPVTARRMVPGDPGFPDEGAAAATPAP